MTRKTGTASNGLFDYNTGGGCVSTEEAGYLISDLVSALSEARPKDGTKASVELRDRALCEGRHALKRLMRHGWDKHGMGLPERPQETAAAAPAANETKPAVEPLEAKLEAVPFDASDE